MDVYAQKLNEMRAFVPFLDKMISKLERANDRAKGGRAYEKIACMPKHPTF